MTAKVNDMVGTATGFTNVAHNDAEVDTYIAVRGWVKVKGWIYFDSTHSVLKMWDGAAWIVISSAAYTTYVLTGGTQAGATGAAQSFTNGITSPSIMESTAGEGVNLNGSRVFVASATDPTPGTVAVDGDRYFNTALGMSMHYDGTRAKWLSDQAVYMEYSYNGSRAIGMYFAEGTLTMTAAYGRCLPRNATIVGMGYTSESNVLSTYWVVEGGVWRASLAAAGFSGFTNATNANVSAGGILSTMNSNPGVSTSDITGWVKLRWRV
jgi:hypothetical protein